MAVAHQRRAKTTVLCTFKKCKETGVFRINDSKRNKISIKSLELPQNYS